MRRFLLGALTVAAVAACSVVYAASGITRLGRGAGDLNTRVSRLERFARPWNTYITTTVADSADAASHLRGGDFWFHRRLGREWLMLKYDDGSIRAFDPNSANYYVRPEDYGAKGDGVADDAAAFVAAAATGHNIFLHPAKTYRLLSGFVLEHDRQAVTSFGATINSAGAREPTITITANGCSVSGIAFRGDTSTNSVDLLDVAAREAMRAHPSNRNAAVYVAYAQDAVVRDCSFNDMLGGGVVIYGREDTLSNRAIVTGNHFENASYITVNWGDWGAIAGFYANDCIISNNVIIGSRASGVSFRGGDRNRITNNRITNDENSTISMGVYMLCGASNNTIADNYIENTRNEGIIIASGPDGVPTNNVVMGNIIRGARYCGISVGIDRGYLSLGTIVSGNVIEGSDVASTAHAIMLALNENTVVADNLITGASRGINQFAYASRNLTITGNVIDSLTIEHGIQVKGTNLTITGNAIRNVPDTGIRVYGGDGGFIGSNVLDSCLVGIRITSSAANMRVGENSFFSNTYDVRDESGTTEWASQTPGGMYSVTSRLFNTSTAFQMPGVNEYGRFLMLYGDTLAPVLAFQNTLDEDSSAIGTIVFSRKEGQSDGHRNVAGITSRQIGSGITAGADMQFWTKTSAPPSPRMTLTAFGWLGLKTETPEGVLDVAGGAGIAADSAYYVGGRNTDGAWRMLGTPEESQRARWSLGRREAGSWEYGLAYSIGRDIVARSVNTTEAYQMTGVDTTASSRWLAVNGDSSVVLSLQSNADDDSASLGAVVFTRKEGQSDGHRNVAGITSRQIGTGTTAGADMQFWTKTSAPPSPRMTLTAFGWLGLKTETPEGVLDIAGGAGIAIDSSYFMGSRNTDTSWWMRGTSEHESGYSRWSIARRESGAWRYGVVYSTGHDIVTRAVNTSSSSQISGVDTTYSSRWLIAQGDSSVVLSLQSNTDGDSASLGAFVFSRNNGQADGHKNVAGISCRQIGSGITAGADMQFWTKTSAPPSPRMTLTAFGWLGLKTETPEGVLDVAGSVGVAADSCYYMGGRNTDGAWRIRADADSMWSEQRQAGVWTWMARIAP